MNNTLANAMSVSVTGLPSSVICDAEFSAHIKREEERISSCLELMGEAQPVSSLKKKDVPTFTWKEDMTAEHRLASEWFHAMREFFPTTGCPELKVGWHASDDGDPCIYFYGGVGLGSYYVLPGMQADYGHLMRMVDCLERMRIVNLVDARGTHPKADINCTPLQSILIKHVLGK